MVVKTTKGYYEILKNVRDAFNIDTFEAYYIEEIFDKYDYIVIDYADQKPRIKGFDSKESKVNFHYIMDYVVESCNYLAPYAILRRVDEAFFNLHKDDPSTEEITKPLGYIDSIEKENYDKDNLVLAQSISCEADVKFDSSRYSNVQLFELPDDIKADIEKERAQEARTKNSKKNRNRNNNQNKGQEKIFTHINSNRK